MEATVYEIAGGGGGGGEGWSGRPAWYKVWVAKGLVKEGLKGTVGKLKGYQPGKNLDFHREFAFGNVK